MYLEINKQIIPLKVALSYEERLKGLMGIKNISFAMYFPYCNAIHTYGMLESIDIIVLNEYNQIILIYNDLKPEQILEIERNINFTHILELPQTLGKYFKIGEYLNIKTSSK